MFGVPGVLGLRLLVGCVLIELGLFSGVDGFTFILPLFWYVFGV